ncbi:SLATT domain-containing protein [Verrucomicrobium sp. BvORR034]|uniref:SLATT domain-containing protein n=1 Tax=Verrucomicrobium sp. BvORR034 TaxID=1396418 RepID=UPI0006791A23|nr:SLATT domain-containing protein [Verrucomicrobium sp. BvORR034]
MSDISRPLFPKLDWSTNKFETSQRDLHEYVSHLYRATIGWYEMKKDAKRWGSRALRIWALIAIAAAGATPVLSKLFAFEALWSTLLLAIAGFLFMFDRLMGCTKGWIRYMQALLQLEHQIQQFRFEWETLRLTPPAPPAPAQGEEPTAPVNPSLPYVTLAQQAIQRLQDVIAAETAEWAADYDAVVRDLEQLAAREREELGRGKNPTSHHQHPPR